jgi:hypothetical protein
VQPRGNVQHTNSNPAQGILSPIGIFQHLEN